MRWLRYAGIALVVVLVICVAAGVASVYLSYTADPIGQIYAQRSAPNLTAAACLKNNQSCAVADDAPIGGLAEYRRCGGVVSAARLKGQPLACSEQWATDLLLRDWTNPGGSAYRQLRRGCRAHDLCYVHGKATYGADRAQCDKQFLAENLQECWRIYGNENESAYLRDRDLLRWACQGRATISYLAVRLMGEGYFEGSEGVVCDHEGGPHSARDQVASGRFLGGDRDYVITLALTPGEDALTIRLLSFGPDGQSVDVAEPTLVSADKVLIGDRDWACQKRRTAGGGFSADCPEWLSQAAFPSPADWLRFAPIVVDADGDGREELIIPSLLPDFGLVFTHVQAKRSGAVVSFEPLRAYLGVARMAAAEAAGGGCEDALEFADCSNGGGAKAAALLSSETAAQNAGYRFTVAASADAGCLPEGHPDKQDVLLLSAFSDFPENPKPEIAEKGGWDTGYVLRRFFFDAQAQRWTMRRDRFNNDWHRMAGCSIRLSRDQFQTHARLQYPPFVARVSQPATPAANAPVCAPDERLALISRDKCPTSTPVARAGGLNDVDLMLYKPDPAYLLASDEEKRETYAQGAGYDELRMAKVSWKPILWAETADPALSSPVARANGVVMVGAFIGGTREIGRGGTKDVRREGQHPVVAVLRAEHLKSLKASWMDRYADTMGHVPDLYGVFKSSSFASSTSENVSNLWDPHRYGPARIYFQIPSVLAPVTALGNPGLSMVFFTNKALWDQEGDPAPGHASRRLTVEEGWFRMMIVPIPVDNSIAQAGMIDCPIDALQQGAAKPAPSAGGTRQFLRHEPVLTGRFFDPIVPDGASSGGMAVAWRDANGEIRLTSLQHAQGQWMFGGKSCRLPEGMEDKELYRATLN